MKRQAMTTARSRKLELNKEKNPETSKSAIQLKDIAPKQDPSGGEKPKTSDIPIGKTSDQASPKMMG